MPGRQYTNGNSYRYGFNGQEKDNEVTNVEGAITTAEFWEYDSRLGRRWNVDPVMKEFESSYLVFNGNPVLNSDIKGNDTDPHDFDADKFAAVSLGVGRSVYRTVVGIVNVIIHPVRTIKGTGHAVVHPINTVKAISNSIKQQYAEDQKNYGRVGGDVFTGDVIGNILQIIAPFAISKLTEATEATGEIARLAGSWVSESTVGWSEEAISYQEYVTGVKAGKAFEVNGVRFDGVRGNTLIEAKSSYNNFDSKSGEFYSWFKGKQGIINQAKRQIEAAGGSEIEWDFSSQKSLDATKKLFKENKIEGVNLKYNPKN